MFSNYLVSGKPLILGLLASVLQKLLHFTTEANGTELSLESFQKIWYLLHFRNANHSNRKLLKEKQLEREILGKKFSKIRKHLARFSQLVFGNSGKNCSSSSFATFRKCKLNFFVEWKRLLLSDCYLDSPGGSCNFYKDFVPLSSHQTNKSVDR